jgi:hypothetical protein
MEFKRKTLSALIVSVAVLVGSFILPIIPCRLSPAVPNPSYQWSFCSLNPDKVNSLNSLKEYWGYTPKLTDAYFLTLVIVFLISLILIHYTIGKNKK